MRVFMNFPLTWRAGLSTSGVFFRSQGLHGPGVRWASWSHHHGIDSQNPRCIFRIRGDEKGHPLANAKRPVISRALEMDENVAADIQFDEAKSSVGIPLGNLAGISNISTHNCPCCVVKKGGRLREERARIGPSVLIPSAWCRRSIKDSK